MYLTATEVMEKLRVSRDTVSRLIRSGDLKAMQLGTGPNSAYRIEEADLQEYIDRAAERVRTEAAS